MAKLCIKKVDYRTYSWRLEGLDGKEIKCPSESLYTTKKTRIEITKITGLTDSVVSDLIQKSKNGGSNTEATTEYTSSISQDQVKNVIVDPTITLLEVRSSGPTVPNEAYLARLVHWLFPQPAKYRFTLCGGMDLYFEGRDGFRSRELALAAVISLGSRDWRFRFGVQTVEEMPAGLKPVIPPRPLAAAASAFRKKVTPEAVQEHLQSRGWHCDQRLPHGSCPLCPKVESDLPEPVRVTTSGIYCSQCEKQGVYLDRRAGYLSWDSYLGSFSPRVGAMVRNATHWTQAEIVLRTELPNVESDSIRKEAYLAAVKLCHGEQSPKVEAVTKKGSDLIRLRSGWGSKDGITSYSTNLTNMIGDLPVTWRDGKTTPDLALRDTLLQPTDLKEYGYDAITPQYGFPVYSTHNRYPDGRIVLPVVPTLYQEQGNEVFRPKYRKPTERMSTSEAWSVIEEALPGIDRNFVQLLIAQKGFTDSNLEPHPFVFTTGPSGSGKKFHIEAVAAFSGEDIEEANYHGKTERVYQAVAVSLDKGINYVYLDELFKNARREGKSDLEALDLILPLTPQSTVHRLNVGARPLGRLPALVIADTSVPDPVGTDTQDARRLVWVKLKRRIEWNERLAQVGINGIKQFRLWKPEAALAADAILSDVTDRFFSGKRRTWADVANELGFQRLEEGTGMQHLREQLRDLFRLVCEAPTLPEYSAKRLPGPGWKAIARSDKDSELTRLWDLVSDGHFGDQWTRSRKVEAEDWSRLMGEPDPIQVEIRAENNTVYVRFFQGEAKHPVWTSATPLPNAQEREMT